MPNKERYLRERKADARATVAVTGEHLCEHCVTVWSMSDVTDDMVELESCPDCSRICERCGMVCRTESHGAVEHCQ